MTQRSKVRSPDPRVLFSIHFFLLLIVYFLLLPSCTQKEKVYRKSRILMDTLVTVNVVSDSSDKAERAIDIVFDEIAKLDSMLNFFSDKSELSIINKNAGLSEVRVSQETIEVIEKAIYASEKTDGAFDATIGPEISLWDFPNKIKPDDKTIRERLSLVNYKLIHINKERSTVYLEKRGMLLDLGGIAKGYAADRAVAVLKRIGIKSGLVSVAGDIKAFGLKPDGRAWVVGIRNPRAIGNDDDIMATIELRDAAISTSGDYERYFIVDGKRYHHILDPKTGYPADECQSVTVIAKDGVYTDSFSTGVFVLGPERGMAALKEMGFEGLIVDSSGSIKTTQGLKDRIEFKKDHR